MQEQISTKLLFVDDGTSRFPLIYDGLHVSEGYFGPNYKPLAVGSFNQVNQVLWLKQDTNQVQAWNMTSDWSFVASGNPINTNSSEGITMLRQFNVNTVENNNQSSEAISSGTLAGIIVGSIAFVFVVLSTIVIYKRRSNTRNARSHFIVQAKSTQAIGATSAKSDPSSFVLF
jgi:hypothetical protein